MADMSKALKLARDVSRSKRQPTAAELTLLTPQESNLLMQAFMFLRNRELSAYHSWEQIEAIARNLDKGGVLDPPYLLRMQHVQVAAGHSRTQEKGKGAKMAIPGVDDLAAAHICLDDVSALTECFISDLLASGKGAPATGRYLRLRCVEQSFRICAIQCCAEDARGAVITVSLYNFISMYASSEAVEKLVPMGTLLTIKEPYMKCSNSGILAIRVDNPCNVIISLPAVAVPTLDAEALKTEGNAFFKSDDFTSAAQSYTKGLIAAEELKVALLSNRAASHLHLCKFAEALADSDAVLALRPTHEKAIARRDKATQGLKVMEDQRQGVYDYMTLPFSPSLQEHGVEDYYGPVEIRPAGHKGRGVFVTRDVDVGELLFTEKAFAYKIEAADEMTFSTNFASKRDTEGSAAQLNWEIIMRINSNPAANAKLATIAYDSKMPMPCPRMDSFRHGFDPTPILSAKRVADACNLNVFSYNVDGEPTMQERRDMVRTLTHGKGDPRSFFDGFLRRSNTRKQKGTSAKGKQRSSNGTALWILGSFMNHDSAPTCTREFFGMVLVVCAATALKAGDEVTTSYSDDLNILQSQWGINP